MTVGGLLREWRERRRCSQLELSGRVGVSARHLSFVETGRAGASRALLLRVAEQLDMPLRTRNQLLLRAGYAPAFGESSLDERDMWPVRAALDAVLTGHEPYPAIVVDECWNLVAANRGSMVLLDGVPTALLDAPLNVMRLCLHPDGLAARLLNLPDVRAAMLRRVRKHADGTGRAELAELYTELAGYPAGAPARPTNESGLFVPIRLRLPDGAELTMLNTIATFGTPLDVTIAGLSMESFFPVDPGSAEYLRRRMPANTSAAESLSAERPDLAPYLAGAAEPTAAPAGSLSGSGTRA